MPFYKLEDGTCLLRGDNFVISASYELYKEQHQEYEYPVDGWYWLDTEIDAEAEEYLRQQQQ